MSGVVESGRPSAPANEVTLGDVVATQSDLLQRAALLTASLPDATPEQLAAINSRFSAALRAINEEPADPKTTTVQGVDVIAKYSFKFLDDGFVRFTLPAGVNYVQLFKDANEYCANGKNDRGHAAMYEDAINWFAKRADATNSVTTDVSHDIQGLVPESTYKVRSEQEALLKKNGLTFPTLEAAAAAAVLYYCATGTDLFQDNYVRTAAPGLGLRSLSGELDVLDRVHDVSRFDYIGCAASRTRKS